MTLDELRKRHSVRSYKSSPIAPEVRKKIEALITDINTHEAGMHIQLITDNDAPFKGFRRSYGMFRGVRNYVAMVVDNSYPYMREKAGYYGQEIVMKATGAGLGTCFVGGTYSAENVDARVRAGEQLICLIALGYPDEAHTSLAARLTRKIAKRSSKKPEEFFKSAIPLEEALKLYPALEQGLEAVALAPSALNKQPVEISLETSGSQPRILAEVPDKNPMQQVDLGIAMYNFQAVTGGYWEWGLPAVFTPE